MGLVNANLFPPLVFTGLLFVFLGFFAVQPKAMNFSCVETRDFTIRGTSLDPLIKDGSMVKGLLGYYQCNPLKRGDLVIFRFKTRKELFVKKLVGLPGDRIEFYGSYLRLNGKILKNSEGKPYLLSERSKRILKAPLEGGRIPEGKFLVLSEKAFPTDFDSRQFGYLEKEHILGKVKIDKS